MNSVLDFPRPGVSTHPRTVHRASIRPSTIHCSAISTKRKSSLAKARAPLENLAPRQRPSEPQDPKQRRSPSASRPRARPTPVPRADRRRSPRRGTHTLARPPHRQPARAPPHPRPARVVVVSSSLPWSSISLGSLSLRRPNSSASRTRPDSTRSPVAFRTTGSCASAAPNYTQPPSVERLENADLWQARARRKFFVQECEKAALSAAFSPTQST